MHGRRVLIALAVLGPALAAGAHLALAQAQKAPPPPAGFELAGDPEGGRAVFVKRCALCHGEQGDGKGKIAATLDPRPKDFTDRERMAGVSDWELYLVIRDGGPAAGLSSKMFGWGKLISDQEIRNAAAFVRSLSSR